MEKVDLTGVSPQICQYISALEKQNKSLAENEINLTEKVAKLTEEMAKLQKIIYGQSSEKTRYVMDKNPDRISMFMRLRNYPRIGQPSLDLKPSLPVMCVKQNGREKNRLPTYPL